MSRAAWDAGVRWQVRQMVAPDGYPLELAFVRDHHLRTTNGTAEDDYITQLIKFATKQAERRTGRDLKPRTLAMTLDRFPAYQIELERPPLISVASVSYEDENGDTQTLATSAYQTSGSRDVNKRFWLAPAPDHAWPGTEAGRLDAVTVTYRSGYGDGASPETVSIPEDILQGMLLLIGEMYKQRSDSVIGFGITVTPAIVRARDCFDAHRIY